MKKHEETEFIFLWMKSSVEWEMWNFPRWPANHSTTYRWCVELCVQPSGGSSLMICTRGERVEDNMHLNV